MGTFNESDHPRDNEGKFTFKGGGTTSSVNSENKMQRQADILYPTMNDKKVNDNQIDYSTNTGIGKNNKVLTYDTKQSNSTAQESVDNSIFSHDT